MSDDNEYTGIFDRLFPGQSNRPSVRTADITDSWRAPGHEETWTVLDRPSGEAAVAKLTGGYNMPRHHSYEAFPEGKSQGELFNIKTPRIEGWYKTDTTSAADAMNVLGVAANESKKRYGQYPQPDDTLSPASAPVVGKLVGKKIEPNYHANASRLDLAQDGNVVANVMVDRMDQAEVGGRKPVKTHSAEDLAAGRSLVRSMISKRKGVKEAPKVSNNPSATKGKQFPGPEHPTLPGL